MPVVQVAAFHQDPTFWPIADSTIGHRVQGRDRSRAFASAVVGTAACVRPEEDYPVRFAHGGATSSQDIRGAKSPRCPSAVARKVKGLRVDIGLFHAGPVKRAQTSHQKRRHTHFASRLKRRQAWADIFTGQTCCGKSSPRRFGSRRCEYNCVGFAVTLQTRGAPCWFARAGHHRARVDTVIPVKYPNCQHTRRHDPQTARTNGHPTPPRGAPSTFLLRLMPRNRIILFPLCQNIMSDVKRRGGTNRFNE